MPYNVTEQFERSDGVKLAFELQTGAAPTLVWLSGFRSDMSGAKAAALAAWAHQNGQAFLRLDYSGHGQSEGKFEDGAISRWRDDALAVIDAKTEGPLALVGSSMGGWIALLIALARPERVKGMLLLAPAPDFTERLMWQGFSPEIQRKILAHGRWDMPSAYDPDPTPITRDLIEDGRKHLLLDGPIPFKGPVRILYGALDPDVPWDLVVDLAAQLTTDDKSVRRIKGGDHRLSRPEDLDTLIEYASALAKQIARHAPG